MLERAGAGPAGVSGQARLGAQRSGDGPEKLLCERGARSGCRTQPGGGGCSVFQLWCLHETFSRPFHSWLLLSDVFVSAAVSNLRQWLSCVSWL